MNDLPADKIKMMKGSIRCLIFGVLALVPVIGLAFGLAALWLSGLVRQDEKQFWNAARPYRVLGVTCAAVGTILWGSLLVFVVGSAVIAAWF
jgi:hypothetical protein